MSTTEVAGAIPNLRAYRESLRLSQAELARIAEVSRYKVNQYEQGSCQLTAEEWEKILTALRDELDRLRQMPSPARALASTEAA